MHEQNGLRVVCGEEEIQVEGSCSGARVTLRTAEQSREARVLRSKDGRHKVFWPTRSFEFCEVRAEFASNAAAAGDTDFAAPMHGTVVAHLVEPGSAVQAGDGVIVIEAMKMEQTLRAPADGVVLNFQASPGDLVDRGTRLVNFEAETAGA